MFLYYKCEDGTICRYTDLYEFVEQISKNLKFFFGKLNVYKLVNEFIEFIDHEWVGYVRVREYIKTCKDLFDILEI